MDVRRLLMLIFEDWVPQDKFTSRGCLRSRSLSGFHAYRMPVARELAGFVWAIGREVQTSGWQGIETEPANGATA